MKQNFKASLIKSLITLIKTLTMAALSLICLFACSDSEKQSGAANQTASFKQPYESMLVYPKKNLIEEFKLVRHDETAFTQANFSSKWNLVFIGYTNCPDVCPNTLTDMSNIYKKMSAAAQQNTQIIFLSVDPSRDNPKHMAQYLDYFHDDFVGISGETTQIDKLVAALGGVYALNTEEGEYYSVDHSARIFIVDPKGQRYGIVSSEYLHHQDKAKLIEELNQMATQVI